MTSAEYLAYFDLVLSGKITSAPYSTADYLHYTKLNHSRQQRWFKTGLLTRELEHALSKIKEKQHWILITEPWCGDASHSVPFIIKMAEQQPMIDLEIQLRDSEGSLIDKYLTNGSKSIPKLIVRSESGKDLFEWGPRPANCQLVYEELKAEGVDFDVLKTALQKWYNEDKGYSLQHEIEQLLLNR